MRLLTDGLVSTVRVPKYASFDRTIRDLGVPPKIHLHFFETIRPGTYLQCACGVYSEGGDHTYSD